MTDLASEFSGQHADFVKHCRRMRIQLNHKERGRYSQNHAAEREIGFLSERWRRQMAKKSVPRRLWDFGLVHEAELLSRLSRGRDGRTGYEEVFGQTPSIAEYVDFEFYDLVWWWVIKTALLQILNHPFTGGALGLFAATPFRSVGHSAGVEQTDRFMFYQRNPVQFLCFH